MPAAPTVFRMAVFSVIIPTYNEEDHIRACLHQSARLNPTAEVIVADAESSDRTVSIAREEKAIVVTSRLGRGTQCNAGAEKTTGEILLFLHVDTVLADNAFLVLEKFFARKDVNIGTFRLRFDMRHWFLDFCGYCTRFDSLWTRFGDQGICARRDFFKKLGGFPDWPLFEDVEFLRRVRQRHERIYSFPSEVITSARKFRQNGPLRQQLKNGILIFKYLMGVPVEKLAKEYQK